MMTAGVAVRLRPSCIWRYSRRALRAATNRAAARFRRLVEAQLRAIFFFLHGAPAIRNQVLTEHDERARGDRARQRFGDRHLANVRVDRSVEREILGERIDEHQCVVDVRPNQRLLSARLCEPESPLRGWLELASEDGFGKKPSKESEHG